MNIIITVITPDPELCLDLVAGNAPDSFVTVSDGVRLKYENTRSVSALSAEQFAADIITFVLERCDDIAIGILASWLYDILKGRKADLHIGDDDEVVISPEAIRQALMKEKNK